MAQSDNIVFVYNLGREWGQKKAICNKFAQQGPVSCLAWPDKRHNEVAFGLVDGKVKVGQLKSNKNAKLYEHPDGSPASAMATSPDGESIVIAHEDGSLHRFTFDDAQPVHARIATHPSPPSVLAWGAAILAAGGDKRVHFYSREGKNAGKLDLSSDESVRDLTCGVFNASGQHVALGTIDGILLLEFDPDRKQWHQDGRVTIRNLHGATALAWRPDGGQISLGSLCGGVDTYGSYMRKSHSKDGRFRYTYVSSTSAVVTELANGRSVSVASKEGYKLESLTVREGKFIIGKTRSTLLLGEMDEGKVSEVQWRQLRPEEKQRFVFDNDRACIVLRSGEAHVVEYGKDEPLAMCRTAHMGSHLLSLRLGEEGREPERRRMAYLIDARTVRVVDLDAGSHAATLSHESKVDFVELNARATHLLFRDKRKQLHIFELASQERRTLLANCTYAQWVPAADVIVAQDRAKLHIWYSVRDPDRVSTHKISGDAESIERVGGKTRVVIDQGTRKTYFELDESLVEFDTALDSGDIENSVAVLEQMELTPESEALWRQLAERAKEQRKFTLCARCYAAVGDPARSRYLRELADLEMEKGKDAPETKAELAMLEKRFMEAEGAYLEHGQVQEAIEMYKSLHNYHDAVRVAEARSHPSVKELRKERMDYYMRTGQEDLAADAKLEEGDPDEAVALLLKGGFPAKAANVAATHKARLSAGSIDAVSKKLTNFGMLERAGELFEALHDYARAKDCYRSAGAYPRALAIARTHSPSEVVSLEAEYGDHLAASGQPGAASTHYVEAGQPKKAVDAALEAGNIGVAEGILDQQDYAYAKPEYARAAKMAESGGDYDRAERLHVRAGQPRAAVNALTEVGKWEQAHRCAMAHLGEAEANALYVRRAEQLEGLGKLKEAEKAYVAAKKVDSAVDMHWRRGAYDAALRLIGAYQKESLQQARQRAAQELEADERLEEAEKLYLASADWKSCVQMYRHKGRWEDAMRVARQHGGTSASKQVAFAWAASLPGEKAAELLKRFGLVEEAVDNAVEASAYEHALDICAYAAPKKTATVRLKRAMQLEDDGNFSAAEEEFIRAGRPKEAVDMHVHQGDYDAALRVAQSHEPGSVQEVQLTHARNRVERRDFAAAERLFLEAQRPELAVDMHKRAHRFEDALRVAEQHVPSRVREVHDYMQKSSSLTSRQRPEGSSSDNRGGAKEEQRPPPTAQSAESGSASAAQGGDVEGTARRAESLLAHGRAIEAAKHLAEHGAPASERWLEVYRGVARGVLATSEEGEGEEEAKTFLARVIKSFERSNKGQKWLSALQHTLEAVHYATVRTKAAGKGLASVAFMASSSLLRYTDEMPADRAFFEAGEKAKEARRTGDAFVMLNRYLDIADAIEEGGAEELDNSDFAHSDIPYDFPLPDRHFPSSEARERARNFVLATSMDHNADQSLSTSTCSNCGEETYEGSLSCHQCGTTSSCCIITGFPVFSSERVKCSNCSSPARQNEWNAYVEYLGCCPWCGTPQSPQL